MRINFVDLLSTAIKSRIFLVYRLPRTELVGWWRMYVIRLRRPFVDSKSLQRVAVI